MTQDIAVPKLVLASASPRRAELLRAAGIEFDVEPANIDESARSHEGADQYVRRIAETKARAVAARLRDRIILAADTTVVVDDVMLAKPLDKDDAKRMLRMLSARSHEVLTAVALIPGSGESAPRVEIETTQVEFASLTEFEIDWYVATGEPSDKAGAYAVQGYASRFVTRIDGSYSNVVGLPIALVYDMLKAVDALRSD